MSGLFIVLSNPVDPSYRLLPKVAYYIWRSRQDTPEAIKPGTVVLLRYPNRSDPALYSVVSRFVYP